MPPTEHDFMRELMSVFAAEADERLAVVDQRLLELERTGDGSQRAEILRDVHRELHTLKGSAGAVNLPDVSRLAHGLESLFGMVDPVAAVDPGLLDRAYLGLDAIRTLVANPSDADVDAGVDVDRLIASLQPSAGDSFRTATTDEFEVVKPDRAFEPAAGTPLRDDSPPASGAPSAPGVSAPAPQPRFDPGGEVVRLSTSKLDSLMARVGELVVTRIGTERRAADVRGLASQVADWEHGWRRLRPSYQKLSTALAAAEAGELSAEELVRDVRGLIPMLDQSDARIHELARRLAELQAGIDGDERRLGQVTADLEEEVRRTRMLPISTVFDPLHRVVRDLARDLGKEIRLVVVGGETEVDRSVLDQIRGPLNHLIRNAVDHGVEPPGVREEAGKPREATIRIAATQRGGTLLLALADDGAGIDADGLREQARVSGTVTPEQLRSMSDRDCLRLVFRSGLSTSDAVTDVSGRGVGLDAVRETVERLNGMIDVASEPRCGTTFTLSLPLSVATTQALLVQVANHRFALPISAVARIASVGVEEVGRAQGREMVTLEDGPVVLTRMEDVLQLTSDDVDHGGRRPVIVLGADERRLALAVDAVLGAQEIVVKPLPRPFVRVRHAAGATLLGTGEVVVVLNTSDLVRSAGRAVVRIDQGAARETARAGSGPGTVLVVDDSIVTRMLEKSILEAAGYDVRVAADGLEAWRIIDAEPVDLVVSDVNMPQLDGLALTARIRSDPRRGNTPVVLVTSLDAPDDHTRAMEAGADAYLVKSSFSQEGLLAAVSRLISGPAGR